MTPLSSPPKRHFTLLLCQTADQLETSVKSKLAVCNTPSCSISKEDIIYIVCVCKVENYHSVCVVCEE